MMVSLGLNMFGFRHCILLCLLNVLVYSKHIDHLSSRVVTTRYGSLRGLHSNLPNRRLQPVEVFLGVPYAGAPEGRLRFMPPVTSPHWKGVKVADRHGPVCPQKLPVLGEEGEALKRMPPGRLKYLKRLLPYLTNQSEDCLYLNIYVPISAQKNTSKLAVMVFIHGDSYEWNSGNPYDGRVLASFGNVIVVTINYRLGVLGFLPTVDQSARGNYGLMDQVAALHWIQDNIAEFGGDVGNVTVFGQGHGAACVNLLMLSPMAKGLFHRAIMQSGSALAPWAIARDALSHALHLSSLLNCSSHDSTSLVECLRRKKLPDLLSAHLPVPDHLSGFGPTVDGIVLPRDPAELMSDDVLFSRYDLLFGAARVESYFRFSAEDEKFGIDGDRRDRLLRTLVRNVYTHHLQEIFLTVVNEYMDWSRSHLQPLDILEATLDALSDATVVAPVVRAGTYHSNRSNLDSMYPFPLSSLSGPKSFFYVFGHQTEHGDYPIRWGCISGEDLAYVFGAPLVDSLSHFGGNYTKAEVTLSEIVIRHWTNFAKVGDPNIGTAGAGPPDSLRGRYEKTIWPTYDPIHQKYLSLSMRPRVRDHYHAHRLSYWLNLIPRLHASASGNQTLHHDRLHDHDNPLSYDGVIRKQRRHRGSAVHDPPPPPVDDVSVKVPSVAISVDPPESIHHNVSIAVKPTDDSLLQRTNPDNATEDEVGLYSMPLVVTVAVGCSLLALNVLVFVAICHQREKECFERKLQEAFFQGLHHDVPEGEKPFLLKDLSPSIQLCPHKVMNNGQALDLLQHGRPFQCAGQKNAPGLGRCPVSGHLKAWPHQGRKPNETDNYC